jgi:hypothetical protein
VETFHTSGVLASHPVYFGAQAQQVVPLKRNREVYTMTNMGLQIRLPVLFTKDPRVFPSYSHVLTGCWVYGIMNCHIELDTSGPLALLLHLDKPYDQHDPSDLEVASRGPRLMVIPEDIASTATMRTIHIPKQASGRIETDTSVLLAPVSARCVPTHCYQPQFWWKALSTAERLKDTVYLLRNTDIGLERLTIAFEYTGMSTTKFVVFVQAGPDIDCGVCIKEFSETDFWCFESGDTFKEWSENTTRRPLPFDLHCSLYTSTEVFVTATVRKEQRLGKDCYIVDLKVLED